MTTEPVLCPLLLLSTETNQEEPHSMVVIMQSDVVFVGDAARREADERKTVKKRKFTIRSFVSHKELNRLMTSFIIAITVYFTLVAVIQLNVLQPFTSTQNSTTSVHFSSSYGQSTICLFCLLLAALLAGYLVSFMCMPPLFGMLCIGIICRNVPLISNAITIDPSWNIFIRKMAFTVILMTCLRLSCISCTIEVVSIAVVGYFLLSMPPLFGIVFGSVLAATSPAVVVPGMLEIASMGLGTIEGIPTLLIAAGSIDNVYAITLFSIFLAIAFAQGSLVWTLIKVPFEILLGIGAGIAFGFLMWYYPNRNQHDVHFLRSTLLLSVSSMLIFGSEPIGLTSAGAIACLLAAFIAGIRWKTENTSLPEEQALGLMWRVFFQPLLFVLIGYALNFAKIKGELIALGIAVILVGLVFRLFAAFLCVWFDKFRLAEKFYITFAFIPKATVQAALASVVLDLAIANPDLPISIHTIGEQILTISVLTILLTAPIGAFLLRITAKKMLRQAAPKQMQDDEVLE